MVSGGYRSFGFIGALVVLAAAGCTPGSSVSTLGFAPIGTAGLVAPAPAPQPEPVRVAEIRSGTSLDPLIEKYAARYDVPASLIHRVIQRESGYNPAARNGPYYGLMQISYATAKTMGYRGQPAGLLDAETNLIYAVKYLSGAYKVGDGSHDRAVSLYARGYYYDAKARGMLEEVGLR